MKKALLFLCILTTFSSAFCQKLYPVKDPLECLYGYKDSANRWRIKPSFIEADDFFGGSAIVHAGGGYGLINGNGEYIVAPAYDFIADFYPQRPGNILLTSKGNFKGIINRLGQEVVPTIYTEIYTINYGQYFHLKKNDLHGVAKTDNLILEAKYRKITMLPNKTFLVWEGLGYPYIVCDTNAQTLFSLKLDKAAVYQGENIIVGRVGKTSFTFDASGTMIDSVAARVDIDKDYAWVSRFQRIYGEKGTSLLMPDGKIYNGKFYREFVKLDNSNYVYGDSGRLCFLRVSGSGFTLQKSAQTYDEFREYSNGILAKVNGKWGVYDEGGNTVIPFEYDYLGDVYDGISLSKDGVRYVLSDRLNFQKIPEPPKVKRPEPEDTLSALPRGKRTLFKSFVMVEWNDTTRFCDYTCSVVKIVPDFLSVTTAGQNLILTNRRLKKSVMVHPDSGFAISEIPYLKNESDYSLGDGFVRLHAGNRVGLMTYSGKVILDTIFYVIGEGKILWAYPYDSAKECAEKKKLKTKQDSVCICDKGWIPYNRKGHQISTEHFVRPGRSHFIGQSIVQLASGSGVLDVSGKLVIPPTNERVMPLTYGISETDNAIVDSAGVELYKKRGGEHLFAVGGHIFSGTHDSLAVFHYEKKEFISLYDYFFTYKFAYYLAKVYESDYYEYDRINNLEPFTGEHQDLADYPLQSLFHIDEKEWRRTSKKKQEGMRRFFCYFLSHNIYRTVSLHNTYPIMNYGRGWINAATVPYPDVQNQYFVSSRRYAQLTDIGKQHATFVYGDDIAKRGLWFVTFDEKGVKTAELSDFIDLEKGGKILDSLLTEQFDRFGERCVNPATVYDLLHKNFMLTAEGFEFHYYISLGGEMDSYVFEIPYAALKPYLKENPALEEMKKMKKKR